MIIIVGDSWGVGEWDQNFNISGPGFGQYLMLHDQVINLSIGTASNTYILDRLESFLEKFRADEHDVIYWIVTCPTRCIDENYFLESMNLHDSITDILHKSFARGNQIARSHNIKLHLIGGLCDLDTIDISLYENLVISVASWGRLLDENYVTSPVYCGHWAQIGEMIKQHRPDLLDQWITIAEHINAKNHRWKNMESTYFGTDGYHPDRRGHLVLRNYLYPQWSHKF